MLFRVLIVALLCLAPSCPPARAEKPIKVGTVLPLTGPQAAIGAEICRGMTLWANGANAAGGINGRNFEVTCRDGQGQPQTTISQLTRLAKSDGVEVMVAVYGLRVPQPQLAPDLAVPMLFPLDGGVPPLTPAWATVRDANTAVIVRAGKDLLGRDLSDAPASLREFAGAYRAAHGADASRAALYGYSAMASLGAAVRKTGTARLTLASLVITKPNLDGLKPYFDVVNPDPCSDASQCRPQTCMATAQACPCQPPPCN